VNGHREAAVGAAVRWLEYCKATDGELKLDRAFVEGLFDAAHDDGSLLWTGEVPAVPGDEGDGLDPDLREAVHNLQRLRDEHRSRTYAAMAEIARLVGLGGTT